MGICGCSPVRALRSGTDIEVQLVFLFIPNVFSGVEVRTLCRALKFFFHSRLGNPCLNGAWLKLRFQLREIIRLQHTEASYIIMATIWGRITGV